MKDTFFQTKGSQMNFCCQSGQKSNVNGETCSFPVCASGCKEGTGCNCPFVFDFAQIPLVTLNTTCTCTTSYIGNTCSYFDCDTAECSTDASCSREFGCKCYTGYDGDGYTCEDIDECKSGYECPGNNTVCVNTMGDYDCKCASGFERVLGECVDIDECKGANDCSPNATCSNYDHGYSCRCNNGFVGNGTYCISTDACGLGHNCSINANCNNDGAGSFFCSCKSGFEGDGYNCSDFNECERNSSICEFGCNNTNGSYECYCDIGFAVNGSRCTDVNECNQAGICGPNAECHNSMGNYSCTCNEGFGGENCSDINECGNGGNNNCSVNAECSNTPGSFNCSCKYGYTGNGYTCEDIDECGPVKTHNCSINADCKNSNGSFTCSCHSGYEGDGYYCNDINECERNLHNCTNSVCNNTEGSFSCLCASGFVWDGSNCTKSESCEQGHNCTTNAECHNTQSSFVCLCPEGFTGDGYSQCEDIDECQMNNGGCDYRVNCTNTNGNRTCSSCPEGYYNSSFSTCSALCGNGICDSTEDCVTCPQDCKDTYCGKCGDGKCDSDVGETCSSCYEDCKSTCEVPTCSSCVHGTCLNGFCTCAESWTGPNCDSAGASIVVTIDDRRPILEIKPNPTNPNLQKFQESITFGISIKRLIEKNSRGEEIKRIELDNDFILVQSFLNSSSNTVWDYYTLLDNKAAINVTFIEFNEDTTYGVFGQPTQFSANTLKVNFRIINWPYSSISNTLDVVMENFVDSGNNNNCVTTENSEDDIAGNLQWLKVSLSGVSMYAKFIARSMIDGRQRDTKFNRTTGSTVTATLPHFWDYAEFDPHYSLLLDSPAEDVQVDECGITTQNEKKDKTGKIAGIAVGTVGGAAVLTASAVYFQSKRRRAQFRKRLTGRINAASSASADSSIPLEANKPAHSSLYRSNESVNPLYHEQ